MIQKMHLLLLKIKVKEQLGVSADNFSDLSDSQKVKAKQRSRS